MSIRLVLVDDHPVVLHGLRGLFEQQDDFQVVATCASADEALDAVRRLHPDVLLLDLRLQGKSGLDLLRTLSEQQIGCRTVLVTAAIDNHQAVEGMQLGVMGIVLKESAPEVLLECVRKVHRGEQWIEQEVLAGALGQAQRAPGGAGQATKPLTPREMEIVRMVAQGLRNRVVAERLSISEGTVKIHLHHIYEKLGVDGRLELVLWAQAKGAV